MIRDLSYQSGRLRLAREAASIVQPLVLVLVAETGKLRPATLDELNLIHSRSLPEREAETENG